jgi:hypothetical protein
MYWKLLITGDGWCPSKLLFLTRNISQAHPYCLEQPLAYIPAKELKVPLLLMHVPQDLAGSLPSGWKSFHGSDSGRQMVKLLGARAHQ